MALLKIKDFDPNYQEIFGGYDIKGLDVYSELGNEKIGHVEDLMVDEQGHFRYFVVDLGFWAIGKKVLLPIERSHADTEGKHLYVIGLTKEQVEELPEFSEKLKINDDRKESIRDSIQHPHHPSTVEPQIAQPPLSPRPLEQGYPLEQPRNMGQIPQNRPQQVYADSAQSVPVSPAPPIVPPAQYPVAQSQVNYPVHDPNVPVGYPPNSVPPMANSQPASMWQRFEARLRDRRMHDQSR